MGLVFEEYSEVVRLISHAFVTSYTDDRAEQRSLSVIFVSWKVYSESSSTEFFDLNTYGVYASDRA